MVTVEVVTVNSYARKSFTDSVTHRTDRRLSSLASLVEDILGIPREDFKCLSPSILKYASRFDSLNLARWVISLIGQLRVSGSTIRRGCQGFIPLIRSASRSAFCVNLKKKKKELPFLS